MITVKKIIRGVKENVMDYDDVQLRIRSATSNDPVGPDMRLLSRIAHDTRNRQSYNSMFGIYWKRLTDLHQPSHMVKALIVAEYLLVHGDPRFTRDMRTRQRVVKRLTGYKFYRNHEDVGAEVRKRSRAVLHLLSSDENLEAARKKANEKISSGEPQRYRRDYGANDSNYQHYSRPVPRQIEPERYIDDVGRDPFSYSTSDNADSRSGADKNRSPFDDPSFGSRQTVQEKPRQQAVSRSDVKEKRRGSGAEKKKKKSSKERKEQRKKRDESSSAKRSKAKAPTYSVSSPSDDEEDLATRQARRAMANVQVYEETPTESVDFLTGQGSTVVSTDWMNDMNFNEVANANGFFDTPANEAIGSPENDGFAFDDALEIDSDDDIVASKSGTGNFWDDHGGLADVSDLRANEFTKKPKKPASGQKGGMTLQQIAAKNAHEEANALAIRPADNFAISPMQQQGGPATAQIGYGAPHRSSQGYIQGPAHPQAMVAYGVQQQPYGMQQTYPPQQQIAMQPYGMSSAPMQPYGLPVAPAFRGPQQVVKPDPFAAINQQGANSMWKM